MSSKIQKSSILYNILTCVAVVVTLQLYYYLIAKHVVSFGSIVFTDFLACMVVIDSGGMKRAMQYLARPRLVVFIWVFLLSVAYNAVLATFDPIQWWVLGMFTGKLLFMAYEGKPE